MSRMDVFLRFGKPFTLVVLGGLLIYSVVFPTLRRETEKNRREVTAALESLDEWSPLIAKECEGYQARAEEWLDRRIDAETRKHVLAYLVLCSHDAPMGLARQLLPNVRRREPYACAQAVWALSDMPSESLRHEADTVDEVRRFCCQPIVEDAGKQCWRRCPVLEQGGK
jgi:hypothetical protein